MFVFVQMLTLCVVELFFIFFFCCSYLPMDPASGKSLGFAFVALDSPESATTCVNKLNGFKFGKKLLQVNYFTDIEKYVDQWPEVYVEPERQEVEHRNLRSWLLDQKGRDQFIVRQGANTEIYWCEGIHMKGSGSLVYDGDRERKMGKVWCEMYTAWSPLGSYLVTYHRQGIALWGGDRFEKINRYAHMNVQNVGFSPCEKFVITWNGRADDKDPRALIVWDVRSGRELRSFKVPEGSEWPIMKWSHDDRFFARMVPNGISVFDTATMKILGGRPIACKGIRHFEWSPSDTLIAYWAPEIDNLPARVVLLDPETKREARSKNLFNVSDVKLHWQNRGDFLCAQVLRHSKSKKTTFTNCEIFRMRDPNIPNEQVEIKENVEHFSWEPSRCKFGIIHGENRSSLNISFYTMGSIKGGKKVEELYTINGKQANHLYWSPAGNAVVLAGLNNINGQLEFWDVEEQMSTNIQEHFMCNEVYWDPSGRMLATVVTQPMFGSVAMRYQFENGYCLWTFQGDLLVRVNTQNFYQVRQPLVSHRFCHVLLLSFSCYAACVCACVCSYWFGDEFPKIRSNNHAFKRRTLRQP